MSPKQDLKRFEEMRVSQSQNPIVDFDMDSEERKNPPTTEPRKSAAGGTIRMKDVFKSSDTNLLGEVNLSDMNILSSNLGESEPRNYVEEVPVTNPYIGAGIMKEIPEQEDMEESQYEQSQAIISELDQE